MLPMVNREAFKLMLKNVEDGKYQPPPRPTGAPHSTHETIENKSWEDARVTYEGMFEDDLFKAYKVAPVLGAACLKFARDAARSHHDPERRGKEEVLRMFEFALLGAKVSYT